MVDTPMKRFPLSFFPFFLSFPFELKRKKKNRYDLINGVNSRGTFMCTQVFFLSLFFLFSSLLIVVVEMFATYDQEWLWSYH